MDSDHKKYNPFFIGRNEKDTKSPKRIRPSYVWTEAEKKNKLDNYIELSKEYWYNIKYGSHIRYITINNEFKTGGFVIKNISNTTSDISESLNTSESPNTLNTSESPNTLNTPNTPNTPNIPNIPTAILLQSTFNKSDFNYCTWIVPYKNIQKIYLKIDAPVKLLVNSLENTINDTNTNIKKLVQYIKSLESKINTLESKINTLESKS